MKENKGFLTQKLISYGKEDFYPFHMPGHKRACLPFPNPWSVDITEIDGFDNLHHPAGILKELQERAADVFGSQDSFLLVNGSTCGLLAAVSGCVKRGGKLLMSRNCHKAVFHALFLRQIRPVYLMPSLADFGIMGSLSPEQVAAALDQDKEIDAVLVISPTYDGVVSDIKAIADITHRRGIPLIVDEAHGAHLPFLQRPENNRFAGPNTSCNPCLPAHDFAGTGIQFPVSSLVCGADIVVQSLHKTLPSFTQTAVLHVNSSLVRISGIRQFLGIYQSSSPSYLLMASMEQCLSILERDKTSRWNDFMGLLQDFYTQSAIFGGLEVFSGSCEDKNCCYGHDPSKILISGRNLGLSGQDLYNILLNKYHLQLEMASGHYVLALTSLMDRSEGFKRLLNALSEIDRMDCPTVHGSSRISDIVNKDSFYHIPKQILLIHEALEAPGQSILLERAEGSVSQEYIYLYPPGIPLVTPGEIIDRRLLNDLLLLRELGLETEGLLDQTNTRINIVN